jgi:hypothetical protein
MDRDFRGLRVEGAGVSIYAPVTFGVGSDNGSAFGRGVSSHFPSSEGDGDREGARIELRSDLLSGSSNSFASAVIRSSGSTSDFGGVLVVLRRFISASIQTTPSELILPMVSFSFPHEPLWLVLLSSSCWSSSSAFSQRSGIRLCLIIFSSFTGTWYYLPSFARLETP